MRKIYPLIHSDDIYAGIEPETEPPVVQGWNDHSEMFRALASDASLIVEIGSWLGRSAIALANAAPNAEIVCIDTWLGGKEMWEDHNDEERYKQLRRVHGYPGIYFTFLQNVVNAGKQSQITPFPLHSEAALEFLRERDVHPDFVYIDGSHNYNAVMRDIRQSLALCPKIIGGDDYGVWEGVTGAVDDWLRGVSIHGCFWSYSCAPSAIY